MSLLGKSINDVIETIYQTIKSKRDIITSVQSEYLASTNNASMTVAISRFKLVDLLDEFEITISQALQGIQTLQTEIFNLQEALRDGFKQHLSLQDNQPCVGTIIPPTMNDDLLFDSIQTNKPINNSISESESNITNNSQVYHKPKASKPLNANSNSRLKFDYEASSPYNSQKPNRSDMQLSNKNRVVNDLLISYSEIEGEPIEQDKSRLPIRQSIRAGLSKQSSVGKDKLNSQINNSKHNGETSRKEEILSKLNQIESEKNYQAKLRKIALKDSYKRYFAVKYGNGSYEEFVRKCNRKEVNFGEIQREFDVMEYFTKEETKAKPLLSHVSIKKASSNPSPLINSSHNKSIAIDISTNISKIEDPPRNKRRHSLSKTQSNNTMKNQPQPETSLPNPYIEPINFSGNFLRGNNSKSQRSQSKPKEGISSKQNISMDRKD